MAEIKRQTAGYSFAATDYDHFQVIYLTEGQLQFRTSDAECLLTAGSGAVLRKGSAFTLRSPTLGYRGVGINQYEPGWPELSGPASAFLGDVTLHEAAGIIEREIAAPNIGSEHVLRGMGSVLCWQALRLAGSGVRAPGSSNDWAERARQAILATLGSGRSVREVLASLPLSYRQLARHFYAQFGHSPKQYQQQCRLQEITRLLRDTSLSITSLAHEFGYPSSQHFSAQFRRATGLTPKAYREQARSTPPAAHTSVAER